MLVLCRLLEGSLTLQAPPSHFRSVSSTAGVEPGLRAVVEWCWRRERFQVVAASAQAEQLPCERSTTWAKARGELSAAGFSRPSTVTGSVHGPKLIRVTGHAQATA